MQPLLFMWNTQRLAVQIKRDLLRHLHWVEQELRAIEEMYPASLVLDDEFSIWLKRVLLHRKRLLRAELASLNRELVECFALTHSADLDSDVTPLVPAKAGR